MLALEMLDYDLLNKNVYLVPLVFPSVALVFGFYSSTNSTLPNGLLRERSRK